MRNERERHSNPVGSTPTPTQVELAFAAKPDMAVMARMTAAAVAARADFGMDQVEDLRIAVDELFVTLAGENGADGRLMVTFSWTEDAIHVTGRLQSPARTHGGVPTELSQRILDALVDEHGSDAAAPEPCMWFVMRRKGVR